MIKNPLEQVSTAALRQDEVTLLRTFKQSPEFDTTINRAVLLAIQQELLLRHFDHPATVATAVKYGTLTL